MNKSDSLNLIGIVLAIVIGLSIASQIENIVEGHRSFYYTNLDPFDYSYSKGDGKSGIIMMLLFVIVTVAIFLYYYTTLHTAKLVNLNDSVKNIVNYLAYLKMLFVGLGILLFGSMSYQIYKHGNSMDIATLVSMIVFVVLYFLGGIYLFFYDKINAIFKQLWDDYKTPDANKTGGGKMVKGGYFQGFLVSFINFVSLLFFSFYGIIISCILATIIIIVVLLVTDDTPSKIVGIVLTSLICISILIFQIYLLYNDISHGTTSISIFIITVIVICFIFSKIYYFINLSNTKPIGIFLNVLTILIIALFSVLPHIFNTSSYKLYDTTIEYNITGDSNLNLIILLILTIEIIMTGVMCFSKNDKIFSIIGSITIIIGILVWFMIVYFENMLGIKYMSDKIIRRIIQTSKPENQGNKNEIDNLI